MAQRAGTSGPTVCISTRAKGKSYSESSWERGMPSPPLLESPQGECLAGAMAGNGINVPGIFYYLLNLSTSFCFTIKQISTLMNIKMLSPHKR